YIFASNRDAFRHSPTHTPQTVAMESKVPFMITHCGGHMFFTDKLSEELAIL
ncbi:unnamed protein product, partial [marine sediment metagenome]